jgi:hypothetical protein
VRAWAYVRIGILLAALASALFEPLGPRAKPPIEWPALFVIFGVLPIALVVILGVQRINPSSAKTWTRPSWSSNFLNFRDPIQFFYFAAFLSVAQGVAVLAKIALTGTQFYVEALVPIAIGAGAWLGVKLAMLLYRSKFEPGT